MEPGLAITNGVRVCFVDIDATITDDGDIRQVGPGYPLSNALLGVLRDVMVEAGWDSQAAGEALTAYADTVVFWDYDDFIEVFSLPSEDAWNRMLRWQEEHLVVYDDAVSMIKQLHARGMPLYIISNNPVAGCLLKLQRAGLGTRHGSPWFVDILGANTLRGQKSVTAFWQRALTHTGLAPETIAVIGDNPTDDCAVPRQVGIRRFFLVDRKRAAPVAYKDGACWVNSLVEVARVIREQRKDRKTHEHLSRNLP